MEHGQEHHSRPIVDQLEELFVSAILRNLLEFSKEGHRSHFALIYECSLHTRPSQMPLK